MMLPLARDLGERALKAFRSVDWGLAGLIASIPFRIVYAVTLGALVGELQGRVCTGPCWQWYGPIPTYTPHRKWDASNV
jgi:hypothetical protein